MSAEPNEPKGSCRIKDLAIRATCGLARDGNPKGALDSSGSNDAQNRTNPRNLQISITWLAVAGIFTDQCVSSTVRSLADESFNVVVVEDCCAATTMEPHRHELEVINMIYCHIAALDEVVEFSAERPEGKSRDPDSGPTRRSPLPTGKMFVAPLTLRCASNQKDGARGRWHS